MTESRAEWVAGLSRQQRRQLHRDAEKRGLRLPPMTAFESRAYHLAGELKGTDVWAMSAPPR